VTAVPQSASPSSRRAGFNLAPWLLLGPVCLYLALVFLAPIGQMLVWSFTEPSPGINNYARIFRSSLYFRVMLSTVETTAIVTAVCLVLGYPVAYVMARSRGAAATILLFVVAGSFWTGFVARTYAWLIILGAKGPVAASLHALGMEQVPQLLFTSFASTLGMVHIMLPFMIFALYAVMSKIDPRYLRAGESLGASPMRVFWEIFAPLSLPGVVNGCVIVFTICLGFYVTPALLGSPNDMMISQVISNQIETLLAFGFASALAMVLLVATMVLLFVYNKFFGLDRLWG
jgi:putative spermidine/putrescine transport system permease protein